MRYAPPQQNAKDEKPSQPSGRRPMEIRKVLSWSFAAVLVATGFCNVAFALDDFKNCDDTECSARHHGDILHPGDTSIFNLMQLSKDQTATLTNTGDVEYNVLIEQGLRTEKKAAVKPGGSVKIAPLDNGYFSWSIYSVLITHVAGKPNLTSAAKARIEITEFTPKHTKCNAGCTSSWNACHQSCALDPHLGAPCLAGCDFRQNVCLTDCSKDSN
jgi:hypothetical protein